MNEEALREFVAEQARAWETSDVETIARAFADDGCFLAPGLAKTGPNEIATAAREYFSQYRDIKIEIRHIWCETDRVAVEWDWSDREITTGMQLTTREAVMIDFAETGKVCEWREYFNREKPTPMIEEANIKVGN